MRVQRRFQKESLEVRPCPWTSAPAARRTTAGNRQQSVWPLRAHGAGQGGWGTPGPCPSPARPGFSSLGWDLLAPAPTCYFAHSSLRGPSALQAAGSQPRNGPSGPTSACCPGWAVGDRASGRDRRNDGEPFPQGHLCGQFPPRSGCNQSKAMRPTSPS